MDVDVSEGSLQQVTDTLKDLPEQLDQLRQAVQDAKSAVEAVGPDAHFNDYTSSVIQCSQKSEELSKNLTGTIELLKMSRSFEAGDATTIYDSFYGVQNQAAADFFKNMFGGILKKVEEKAGKLAGDKVTDKFNDKVKDKLSKINTKADNLKTNIEDKFKAKVGTKYDKDYKLGKNWFFGTMDFKKFELFKKKGSVWHNEDESIKVLAGECQASFSVGPDHVVADASFSGDVLKLEKSYNTPALKTSDGLEVLSGGVSGDVSVLHAEGSAKVGLGGYYKDGKKHFEAGAQVKLEADLVKADASAQGTLLGVTGKVSAGVKIGIGAQADIGYVDKKLHCNLSAAAGLGFEVGFTLDFGKVTDYLASKIRVSNNKADYLG